MMESTEHARELTHLPSDVLREILRHIDLRTAGRLRQVNWQFHDMIDPMQYCTPAEYDRLKHINQISRLNELWRSLTGHLGETWNWNALDSYPSPDWCSMSSNKKITLDKFLAISPPRRD